MLTCKGSARLTDKNEDSVQPQSSKEYSTRTTKFLTSMGSNIANC